MWGVSSAWWHVRTALRFALWDQWQKGSVYGALSQLPYLWCGGCLKVINWGWRCKSQKGSSFHREGRVSLHVILLYCETLLQILLGIYCKKFYWIPLFTILLFYVFEVDNAKSATQCSKCPNDINTKFCILNRPSSPCLFFVIIVFVL